MKIKSKFLLLAITIFFSQNSLAEKKIKMESPNEYNNYLFTDIKKVKPNVYRFWMEVEYKEDVDKEGRLEGEVVRRLHEIDCNQATIKIISIIEYNKDGDLIESMTRSGNQIKTKHIVPDTYGEQHMNQVCNLKKNK